MELLEKKFLLFQICTMSRYFISPVLYIKFLSVDVTEIEKGKSIPQERVFSIF